VAESTVSRAAHEAGVHGGRDGSFLQGEDKADIDGRYAFDPTAVVET